MEYSPFSAPSPGLPAPFRPAAAAAPGIAIGNLGAIIERAVEALAEETEGVQRNPRYDLKASTARKSRCLYELSRASKSLHPAEVARDHGPGLRLLREKLTENESAVRAHLNAVGEIAALIGDVVQRAQSDGTYSASAW